MSPSELTLALVFEGIRTLTPLLILYAAVRFGDRWLSDKNQRLSDQRLSDKNQPYTQPSGDYSEDESPLDPVSLSVEQASPTGQHAPADRREAEIKLSEHLRKEFAAQNRAVTQAEAQAQAKLMLDSVVW